MNLALSGFLERGLRERVERIAASVGLHASDLAAAELLAAGSAHEADWDLIALGPEFGGEDLRGAIEGAIEKAANALVIVIAPEAEMEAAREWKQAGAFDAVAAEAEDREISDALARAAAFHRRGEQHWAAAKLQVISQLAAGVGHEINNPLTGLMGTAELMLREPKLSEKQRKDVTTILAQAKRIHAVTARLRHLDRLRTVPYDEREQMLDLASDPADDRNGAEADEPPEAPERIETPPTLLVIDDNPLIAELVERALEGRFIVHGAMSAYEAIKRFEERAFDLVLLDSVMPETNTNELLARMLRMRPGQKVLMSVLAGEEKAAARTPAGAAGTVKKPFNFDELAERLADALGAERSLPQRAR